MVSKIVDLMCLIYIFKLKFTVVLYDSYNKAKCTHDICIKRTHIV